MFFIVLSKIFEIKKYYYPIWCTKQCTLTLVTAVKEQQQQQKFTKLRLGMYSRSNKETSCLTSFLYSLNKLTQLLFTKSNAMLLRHQINKNRDGICRHGAYGLVEKKKRFNFLIPFKYIKTSSMRSIREKGMGLWTPTTGNLNKVRNLRRFP